MSLAGIVRAREWWDYKIPPLLAAAYILLHAGGVTARVGVPTLGLLLVFLTATASFGYFVNDVFDMEVDRAAGKRNAAAELDTTRRAAVLGTCLALALVPWVVLPHTTTVLGLVAAELGLLVAYAAPPLRLKTRGAAALVADALYAHTLPMLIAVTAFARLGTPAVHAPTWVMALLVPWSFLTGVRGILLHQIDDLAADRRAGVRTAVDTSSRVRAVSLVTLVLMPLELLTFVGLSHWLSQHLPWFAAYSITVLVLLALRARRTFGPVRPPPGELDEQDDPAFVTHRRFADFYGSGVLNDYYEQWMPLLPLALLCVQDPAYCIVAVGHVLAFRGPLNRG